MVHLPPIVRGDLHAAAPAAPEQDHHRNGAAAYLHPVLVKGVPLSPSEPPHPEVSVHQLEDRFLFAPGVLTERLAPVGMEKELE